jgi:hypothetical protein
MGLIFYGWLLVWWWQALMEVMDRVMLLRDIWHADNTDLLYWTRPAGGTFRKSV